MFNRRQLKADYGRSVAVNLEAYYGYQKAIQTGFREVSTNLRGLENYRQVAALRQQEVETLTKAIATATDLQVAGYATYLEVITAQRSALEAELSLAEVRRTQFLQAIDLYRALGGGWAATAVPAGR
ncbi:TolC family protein [Hymenobacter sp. AT01-02]|uniref:TolC family protein n=1 Tax=Hymenobacter sp. AT01-02 TaxID=1571877 RepID=UPI0029348083|nr:TolC family protein [Hymenobacter sp. AT01-02]